LIPRWLHRARVKWLRWRLLRAYATEFRVRHQKGPGFSPMLYALQEGERDSVLEVVDGEVVDGEGDDAV